MGSSGFPRISEGLAAKQCDFDALLFNDIDTGGKTAGDDFEALLRDPPDPENENGAPVAAGSAVDEAGEPLPDKYCKTPSESNFDDFDALLTAPTHRAVALDLAGRGFAIFPIVDFGDGDGWKPIKGWRERATTDADQIAKWWQQFPDARVGLPTGACNGISVLDLDRKAGKDGVASLADLGFPDLAALSPVRVRTPSGGAHIFFVHHPDLKNSVSKIGAGIDVRTDGGYVVAPNVVRDGRRYETEGATLGNVGLPDFPAALIPPSESERDPVEPLTDATPEQRQWAADQLGSRATTLADMTEGGRNDALNAAAMWAAGAAAHGFLSREEAEAALLTAAASSGLPKREAQRTFAGAWKAGLSKPITDFPRLLDLDALDDLPDIAAAPASHLRFLSPGECADAPSRGYVVKGFLAPGDVACIYGAPGAGKSLIAPHIGYAVSQGRAAFGMRTKAGGVFYVAAEDPHGMRGRVSALKLRHGNADGFTLVEGVSDLLQPNSADLVALYSAVKQRRPSLIFIDTLAMSFPGLEENSAEAMGLVVAIARKLASHGAAVVLIHHDTKAGTPTPRGHSLLNGALDVALQLHAADESGIVRGKLSKNRNGSCDRDFAFRIDVEEMGTDEDGDPITYALVDELDAAAVRPKVKLSPSERAALSILSDMVKLSEHCPVQEDDWRAACINARTVSASDDRESRRRATRRAFEGLARKSAVFLRNGTAILPDISGCPGGNFSAYADDLDPELAT